MQKKTTIFWTPIFLTIAFMLLVPLISAFADTSCLKCDINKVKKVNDHLDSLTFQIVSDFLCTFDKSCKTNVEYSEWSNETLFKVLDKAPNIFFQVLAKGQVDNKLLQREIESPVIETDIQKIYNKIKVAIAPTDLKGRYLNALRRASDKSGQTIIDSATYWVNQKYLNCLDSGKSVCQCQEQNNFLILHIDTIENKLSINPSIYYSWETETFNIKRDKLKKGCYTILPPYYDTLGILTMKENQLTLTSLNLQTTLFTKIKFQRFDNWTYGDMWRQIGIINCKPLLKYSIKLCGDSTAFPLTTKIISDYISTGQISISCSDDYHYNAIYIQSTETQFFLVYENDTIKAYKQPQPRGRGDKVDISKLKDCQLFYKNK